MLVLSRRIGEEIVIDGHIRVRVIAIRGDQVRVGIVAPSDVRVDRLEVRARRLAEAAAPSCNSQTPRMARWPSTIQEAPEDHVGR